MISSSTAAAPRKALTDLQRRRKLAISCLSVLMIGALPLIQSNAAVGMFTHEAVETAGVLLIAIAILGRAWCTLYIGGRKAQELTDSGPYSLSRNPLYVFSFIGGGDWCADRQSFDDTVVCSGGYCCVFTRDPA